MKQKKHRGKKITKFSAAEVVIKVTEFDDFPEE